MANGIARGAVGGTVGGTAKRVRNTVVGGASIGLSVLLVALLLATAPPLNDKPSHTKLENPPQTARLKPKAGASKPQSVVLPPPPQRQAAQPSLLPLRQMLQPQAKPIAKARTPITPLEPAAPTFVQKTTPPPPRSAKAVSKPAAAEAKAVAAQGRVLLRLLEHGQGPMIELAWPRDGAARSRLYRRFRDCFGMQVALRSRTGAELFIAQGSSGASWQPNRDRYSGFARQPSGRLVEAERNDLRAIARRHNLPTNAPAMRIFPRAMDARLLGGLNRLLAGHYAKARSIRARYQLDGGRVTVRDIRADGRAVPGVVDLSRACVRS